MNRYDLVLFPLVLASALLLGVAPSAAAGGESRSGEAKAAVPVMHADECALRYHASLGRIGAADLPLLKRGAAQGGETPTVGSSSMEIVADQALPGAPLFMAPARQRSRREISALTAAVALARSRGRTTAVTGSVSPVDRAAIAARLGEDLGDYLGQKATPYLCNGVPAYLETLRSFAARLGPGEDRRAEWIATQRSLAERSLREAAGVIGNARTAAETIASQTGLRPATGIARTDAAPAAPETELASEADLLAAIDRLVGDAKAANLVSDAPVAAPTGATTRPAALPRPVLAKLAEARPLVVSGRPLIRDRVVRLKLLAAFSDIEMLDYLLKATPEAPDPIATAIGRMLGDIEAAHAADCTCGGVRP